MVLLDTCTLLWLAADQGSLSEKAKKTIAAQDRALFVSAISAFEIAIKTRNGKLKLPLKPATWFAEALVFHGIREIPVTSRILMDAVALPAHHDDPCDRIIIASAALNKMKIITCDRLIAQYKQAEVIW